MFKFNIERSQRIRLFFYTRNEQNYLNVEGNLKIYFTMKNIY